MAWIDVFGWEESLFVSLDDRKRLVEGKRKKGMKQRD